MKLSDFSFFYSDSGTVFKILLKEEDLLCDYIRDKTGVFLEIPELTDELVSTRSKIIDKIRKESYEKVKKELNIRENEDLGNEFSYLPKDIKYEKYKKLKKESEDFVECKELIRSIKKSSREMGSFDSSELTELERALEVNLEIKERPFGNLSEKYIPLLKKMNSDGSTAATLSDLRFTQMIDNNSTPDGALPEEAIHEYIRDEVDYINNTFEYLYEFTDEVEKRIYESELDQLKERLMFIGITDDDDFNNRIDVAKADIVEKKQAETDEYMVKIAKAEEKERIEKIYYEIHCAYFKLYCRYCSYTIKQATRKIKMTKTKLRNEGQSDEMIETRELSIRESCIENAKYHIECACDEYKRREIKKKELDEYLEKAKTGLSFLLSFENDHPDEMAQEIIDYCRKKYKR